MNFNMRRLVVTIFAAGFLFAGGGVRAEDPPLAAPGETIVAEQPREEPQEMLEPKPINEGYFGLLVPFNNIGGDFDGNRIYSNVDGTAIVPDIDPGVGLGLVVGLKHTGTSGRGFAMEASLQGSAHDGEMTGGLKSNVSLGILSGDLKFFPTTGGAVEPWIQVGLCAAAVQVEDGFFFPGGQKDATYTGGGFNLGLGVMRYVSDRFALHLAGIYRFIEYDELDYDKRAELSKDLEGGTLSIELGATLRFNRH